MIGFEITNINFKALRFHFNLKRYKKDKQTILVAFFLKYLAG